MKKQQQQQENEDLIERWRRSNDLQPPAQEENQLSSRSVERPALLNEVEDLVKSTQKHLEQLRQEAEVHAQILQDFQKELDACSTSSENAESDSDGKGSVDSPKKSLQVESAHKEVNTKLPQPQDKDEDEKKDDGAEKLLNTDTVQSNKDKTKPEGKLDAKQVNEKEAQQVDKKLISDEQARLAAVKLLALKADIAKTLEGLQSPKKSSVELPDSGRRTQYRKQEVVPSDEPNRIKIDRPCRAKPLETQGQHIAAEKSKGVDRNRHSKMEIHKVQYSHNMDNVSVDRNKQVKTKLHKAPSLENVNKEDIVAEKSKGIDRNRHSKMEVHKAQYIDNIDNVSVDTSKQFKTKVHKAPSLENINKEPVDKTRHSKTKLDEIQRLENAANISEGESKDRHSKTKSYKPQTIEDAIKTYDDETHSRKDLQESVHQTRHPKRKHRKHKHLNEVPATPTCSCSSSVNQEEIPKSLPPANQIEPSVKTSERHTTQSKGIQEVTMAHKRSQTTSNTSVIHIKEEVRSTIQQVHNTKQLTVQQLPSLNIRRTLSVQKVPSIQIPPPGAAAYVSPRQNIAFWGMSEDGAAVEVQKYGLSSNVNSSSVNNDNNADTVKEQREQVVTLEEPTLPKWRDNFTETEMYTWFCETCRNISDQNVNVAENEYLSQCKECLRHFPISELFQQHCIECQVLKRETRLDQCVKCLCSVPSTEIINNHCLKCQSSESVQFYQETLKLNTKKQDNFEVTQVEKIDLPEKEPVDNKDISNTQQLRNLFSYSLQRKETEREIHSEKEIQPADTSRSKTGEPVEPEYSRNDYQVKGDIVSSLAPEEIMQELESYLEKELSNVGQDFGHLSDVSSLEEYLHSKGQDTECNLSDTELGELILNSLSARLQQQSLKPGEWDSTLNKVLHEPVMMVFRGEISEGSDHSGKKSPRSQRAKSAPAGQLCNEKANTSSNRESSTPGARPFTQSKYHQHCFDSVRYPVEPAKVSYPTFRNKKSVVQKSPLSTPRKHAAHSVKQAQQSRSPEKAKVAKRTPKQFDEQDTESKLEEEESKNKLHPAADSDDDADYDTDNVPETSGEEYGKITEESYEDDWEEESQHSLTEGVKPQAEEAGTQTDTVPPVVEEPIQEFKSDKATSPVESLRKGMVSVDVQTSEMIISTPSSESLPPSEATLPAATVLVNKLQNACRCSPDIEATEQALRVVIGEKQMYSLADKLQIVCKCSTNPPEVPRVTLVDKETSTEDDNVLVDAPDDPGMMLVDKETSTEDDNALVDGPDDPGMMLVDKVTSTEDDNALVNGPDNPGVVLIDKETSTESNNVVDAQGELGVMLLDKETSTEDDNALVDVPIPPLSPDGDRLNMVCMSPSTCGTLHKTVANAAKGAWQKTMVDKAVSPKHSDIVQGEKTVRIAPLPPSDQSDDSERRSSVSVQTSQVFNQPNCFSTKCARRSRTENGSSSTDDDSNKMSAPGSRSSDDEMTSSTSTSTQTNSEPATSTGSTHSGETQSCFCDHGTVSQGEVLFDMQPSEGEVLLNASHETVSTGTMNENVLQVVDLNKSVQGTQTEDEQSDGEISEGQVFLH